MGTGGLFKGNIIQLYPLNLSLIYTKNDSVGLCPAVSIIKKGALDSQSQVIKFTSCLPRVSGSLRVLRLPPPLKLAHDIAEILLKVVLTPKIKIKIKI